MWLPLVCRMVIFHTALHVLKLVQHGKHVDELPQREKVGLRHEVLPTLGVTESTHFPTETIYRSALKEEREKAHQHSCVGSQNQDIELKLT